MMLSFLSGNRVRRTEPLRAIAAGCAIVLTISATGCSEESAPVVITAAVDQPRPISVGGAIRPGQSKSGNYLAGRFAHKSRDFGAASTYLSRALQDDPTNVDLLRRALIVTIADGEMGQAFGFAQRLIEFEKNASLANLVVAAQEIKTGQYAKAKARLETVPRRGLNLFMVPLVLAWADVGNGDYEKALAALEPLKNMRGFSVLYSLHAGLIEEVSGNDAAAETFYDKASERSNRSTLRIVQARGLLYERTGRFEQAKALYNTYLSENPDSLVLEQALQRIDDRKRPKPLVTDAQAGVAEAFFNVAGTLTQENSAQMALVYGRLALHLRSDFPIAQMLVGRLLESLGRQEDAIEIYDQVARSSALYWSARLRKAFSLELSGEEEEAIRQLREMSEEDQTRYDVLINLGDLLRSKKRFVESVDAYDDAIERIGEVKQRHWTVLYSRGISLERSKQWPRAEKDFKAALELNPDQPYVLNYLGYSWVDQGVNLERARAMIEKAVELRPNDGYIVDSLGWAMYRLGDFEGAVRELERAVELRPQDPTINDHLGDAYWRVGREFEAKFQWRRALSLDPEPEQLEQIKDKIVNGMNEGEPDEKGS